MHEFGRAVGNSFVLEQRVGALTSQLAELENLRARVFEAERRLLQCQRLRSSRRSDILPALLNDTADWMSIRQ